MAELPPPTPSSISPLPTEAEERAALRGAARVSVLAGLCPLIPLPFVDDWAEGVVRRRAVRDLLRGRGLETTPGDVEVLAGLEQGERGCLHWALLWTLKLAWYVVRKLVRKIIFVFAAHDAVNAASSLLVDVWLLRSALAAGVLDPPAGSPQGRRIDRDRARRVRDAMEATVRGAGARPLERAVRGAAAGSRALVLGAARHLGRWARGERRAVGGGEAGAERAAADLPLGEEERELGGLIDRLTSALWRERGFLAGLEQRFHHELAHRLVVPGGIDASVGDRRA